MAFLGAAIGGLAAGAAGSLLGGGGSSYKPSGPAAKDVNAWREYLSQLRPQQGMFADTTQRALGAFGSFDPLQAQKELFSQQMSILSPYQEQQRQQQNAQLLRQGRLGSTGGGVQQKAFEDAVNQQNLHALYGAFGQSQGAQQNLLGLATGAFSPQLNLGSLYGAMPGSGATPAQASPFQALGGAFLGGLAGPIGTAWGNSLFKQTPATPTNAFGPLAGGYAYG